MARPDQKAIRAVCPGVDEGLLQELFSRLTDRYFTCFSPEDICGHLRGFAAISPGNPAEVLTHAGRDGSLECTVLAFDYPFVFSIITGILAGMGFSIDSGDVFTYGPDRGGRGNPDLPGSVPAPGRRKIIDRFSGRVDTTLPFPAWVAEFKGNLVSVIGLLESGDKEAVSEAKNRVNEMVVRRLARLHPQPQPVLYPLHIKIEGEETSFTRLRVVSEDTPAFLYALSNALSLNRISIEHVKIRTIRGRVEDEIELVDSRGRAIRDRDMLDRVKLSVLLTKQFTYFLATAPDPYTALSRFESLVREILGKPGPRMWLDLLGDPHALKDLARVLGASDFLWEDFIRLQYEMLLPLFEHRTGKPYFSREAEPPAQRLEQALRGACTYQDKRQILNRFKDREIFLIDLDHIIHPETGVTVFSEKLTELAQAVTATAVRIVYDRLVERYGRPRSVGDLEAGLAVLGLGKLGGVALGYASDLELLFVYGDNGETGGPEVITNAEFFERLVKEMNRFITAKREGIFQIDLRLRPFGSAGPPACSLDAFCRYYGRGGQARSYERLALVRMRAIGGDPALGRRLERIRDEIVYYSRDIDLKELHELRERQFREKAAGERPNAKFSPGGLVDLEYGIQILQVMHGRDVPKLRTPRLHEALSALGEAGVLGREEAGRLTDAYYFLRNLINGLRMLRGSARDLFLPPAESMEFEHLARRLGYGLGGPVDPAQQLRIDFETHTAAIRAFADRHFGPGSLPGPGAGTVADILLSDRLDRATCHRILSKAGFRNPGRAYLNLKRLAGEGLARRESFTRLALMAFDILSQEPDPDMALNNWERYINVLASPDFHYNMLLSQPMRLEILLSLFSASRFLADTLVRNPEFLEWLIIPELLNRVRRRSDLEEELRQSFRGADSRKDRLNRIRRFRRREILRIGARDIFLKASTRDVMLELSLVAEALVQVALEEALRAVHEQGNSVRGPEGTSRDFCIMALGKLGGSELNYSSDIDLIGLWDDREVRDNDTRLRRKEVYRRCMERVRSDLNDHTEEGYAYRVDLRLRPFGSSGELVSGFSGLVKYYERSASLWEIQAALKLRPIAGNLGLGQEFLDRVRPVMTIPRRPGEVAEAIDKMRNQVVKGLSGAPGVLDVKNGYGGIRDVEFLVQGLQLIHGHRSPRLVEANTLSALDLLEQAGVLSLETVLNLKEDYIFLRRTEHCLQILDDRQTHALPVEQDQLSSLAKRMMGHAADAGSFREELNACLARVRAAYEEELKK